MSRRVCTSLLGGSAGRGRLSVVGSRATISTSSTTFLPSPSTPSSAAATTSATPYTPSTRSPLPEEARSKQTLTSPQAVALAHLYQSPAPSSALSAFEARLSLNLPLPLVEQTLIHPSFWSSAPIDAQVDLTLYHDAGKGSNEPLATLGNALLGTLTSELLMARYPSLPTRVTKAACTMYVGPRSLSAVASSWGVGPTRLEGQLLAESSEISERKMKRADRAYGHLVGGVGGGRKKKNSSTEGASGGGLVRWNRRPMGQREDAVLYEDALASVARAVVGAIYQAHGFEKTRTFVHSHFLSRLLSPASSLSDLTPLLKFTSPTSVLSSTLSKHALPSPSFRLLHESGRLSAHPTFVTGVFAGEAKLGEGFGSSIKMSEWRASEDALRRYYLARGEGKGLPSDEWAGLQGFRGVELGESEVLEESRA